MLILALDTSGESLSVSILENKKIISKIYVKNKNFHSEKILSCTQDIIKNSGYELKNIDLFAVCNGPGSFTGIRVGMAFIKGMTFMLEKPCIGISSLLALAYQFKCSEQEIIYSCLYANQDEIYFNSYINKTKKNSLKICQNQSDNFLKISEIEKKAKNEEKKIIFVGNMAEICYNKIAATCSNVHKFYNTNVDSDYIGQAAYDEDSSNNYLNKKLEANYIKNSRAEKI